MKLLIGLGNPGKKYVLNRHNVGYMAIDWLKRNNLSSSFILKKSGVFMNSSGTAVKKLINYYSLDTNNLYVVYDDLDIPLGKFKIQKGTGPKNHKGLNSIYSTLNTKDFWHIRIGVDNRIPSQKVPGEDYVLSDFTNEEKLLLNKTFTNLSKELAK